MDPISDCMNVVEKSDDKSECISEIPCAPIDELKNERIRDFMHCEGP